MKRALPFLLALYAHLFSPLVSSAQDDAAAVAEARKLFESGRDKLEAGQHAAAAADFRRSLELSDRSSTRFNFAIALCGSGQYVEGIEQYELLLRTTDLEPEKRNEVIEKKAEAETRLSRIALTNSSSVPLTVFVDAKERAALPPRKTVVLAVNPGVHDVFARGVADARTHVRQLTTHSGQTVSHTFELTQPVRPSAAQSEVDSTLIADGAPTQHLDDASSDDAPVWPWVVLGIVAAGGVALTAVLLSGSSDDEAFDARAETLSVRF